MKDSEVDVLVVGFGPVGAAIGCLLGRYGVRTLVIDKAKEIFAAPRAIALDNEALRILDLVGLSDGAFAKLPIPYVRMRCPYVGEFAKVDTSGTIDGYPKLATFYQPELERALRKLVTTHDCVATATGVELDHFVEGEDLIRAHLTTADGERCSVRARFLVGADGASSKVRALIGQDFAGKTYAEDWLIVDALNVPGTFDHVEFMCDPRRPTPRMIAPGGRTRWEFMLRPGETREEMEKGETIRGLLAPWANASVQIERKAVYRFHARSCNRYRRGRAFLVGDAAHVTPPFVGQGLVAGLRDAANLAWKLAWVVKGRAHESILETYDEERRPHATKMIALAKLMGKLVMPRNAAIAMVTHSAMKLARLLPGLRGMIEGLGIKPKPAFRRGLFAKGRGRLQRGSLLPQMLVTPETGTQALSDEVLGANLALVGIGANAEAHLGADTRRRWADHGGTTASFVAFASADSERDATPMPERGRGWCVVVRPDRTILHDGPLADADRIVREAIGILDGVAT
jgi:3-(3-hydroxy-phenyl)propionate hydroxylase